VSLGQRKYGKKLLYNQPGLYLVLGSWIQFTTGVNVSRISTS